VIDLAVLAAIVYFAAFGVAFIVRPQLVERFALGWSDPAGKTEVRCYYGGVSCALAGFLLYLLVEDLGTEALTGVLLLASAVLVVRVAGTVVDGGRDHPYTRTAIPVEAVFVVGLALVRALG
jgi:hypothetical protein